jgi:glycosyltransferase involved in cell wall biosynthesis
MSSAAPARILFLNQTYRPDPVATSQYLAEWAEHLAREGHDVTVLTSRRAYHATERPYAREEMLAGVRVVRMSGTGFGKATRWGRVIDLAGFLVRALMRGSFLPRPDVVVALTSPPLVSAVGAILARRFGARFIYWVMDLHPDSAIAAGWLTEKSVLVKVTKRVSRWSLRHAERVMALDSYIKARLIGKGVPAERIDVIPLWILDAIRFDREGRETVRRERGWDEKFVVMLAGNHGVCHPLDTLLDAAAELEDDPRVHFCFVGGGAEWPRLHAGSAQRKNITVIDYVPLAELPAILSAADAQVVIMGESFVGIVHPCKIYNLIGIGRPVIYIGPPVGPVPEVIAQAGLQNAAASFRHGECGALADSLRKMVKVGPPAWPSHSPERRWARYRVLEEMTSALGVRGRCIQSGSL